MQQTFKTHIRSASMLLINNGRLANPMNEFSKAIKKITGKRHKTDADFEELMKLEWYGSLYLKQGKPCIPGVMMDATLINGAKKVKKGMQAKAGLFSVDDFPLQYEGPQNIDDLWLDERFRFVANVRLQGRSSVLRCRPCFPAWETDIEIAFNDEMLNFNDIEQFLVIAGRDVGLGNWRPRYGRFDIVK